MVVDDLDVAGSSRTTPPFEADAPLNVDTDAILASTIAFQRFQPVAPERLQFVKVHGCVKDFQPTVGLPRKALKLMSIAVATTASSTALCSVNRRSGGRRRRRS
jgi:hypothetical protein